MPTWNCRECGRGREPYDYWIAVMQQVSAWPKQKYVTADGTFCSDECRDKAEASWLPGYLERKRIDMIMDESWDRQ